MKKTENYAMPYPEQDDYFNVEDFQNMMVSVDNLMKKLSDSGAQISSDAEHLYNQTKAQMDNIQKRMNTFTSLKDGSTTGDAELTDIRVAYDGKEYGNAGEAVREQASDIHKALFGAGASIWSKAKSESTKYVAETKGICILNERFTAAGVVAKISRGTFAQNESTLNLDRECSAYIVEFEKNPGTVYMPSAETIKIVSTTKIIFEANGNARCWIPVKKGQYLAVDSTATAYTSESNHVPYMLYDQANKTLECRGFGSTGSIEPVAPYSLALEYKLEYDMDDTGLVKQIDANREDVASLKEDIVDFKDLADFTDSNDDSKDTLYIVDVNGKIIATVSKEGIDTVGYKKCGEDFVSGSVDLLETYDDVFYIADGNGNVIFKASKNGIEGVNISASSPSPYKDKVLISIGDSLSAHDKWQKWLVEWWGCNFDADKNVNGDGDYPPMAKGGTAIIPNSTDSIYIRALSASHYNPDIIILYAGQNDVPHFGSDTEVNSSAVGTIDDVPYKKTVPYTELKKSEYSDYTSWYEGRPTLYSCCMGLVENLLTSCPKAQIIVVTPMQMWTSDGTQSVGRKQLVTTWHDICNKYALPIVDLWNKSGVNVFNTSEYYPNAGNVHPNDYGYKRIAETIYSEM